jgi:hypothetical protein
MISGGGFGQVWRGYDMKLHRPVAVKLPLGRGRAAPGGAELLVEACKVANLEHSGIVPVFDVAQDDGKDFIVSLLIEGTDLGERLRTRPPSLRESLRIVAEVAEAVHAAHQQGVIHRDVKPGNILLDARGRAFVTDFGIAVTAEELRQQGNDGSGTLAYMAPEQLSGGGTQIDRRTDIYSLGVVFYELLTGGLPFQSRDRSVLSDQVLREEPPPIRSIAPDVPREAERICLRCLAKSPAHRYRTAQELAREVRRLHTRLGTRRWRKALLTFLTFVTVGAATLCIFQNRVIQEREARLLTALTAKSVRDAELEKAMECQWEGKDQEALDHLEIALSHWKSATLLCLKAELLLKVSKFGDAEACCDEVLRLDPANSKVYYIRGLIYEKMKEPEKALESFRQATEKGERRAIPKANEARNK